MRSPGKRPSFFRPSCPIRGDELNWADDPVLRRIDAALAADRPLAPEDAAMLRRNIREGRVGDTAAGIRYRRNALILEIGATLGGSARSNAREIQSQMRRYSAGSFVHDRNTANRPTDIRGKFFDLLHLTGGKQISWQMLDKVLRQNKNCA